MSIILLILLIGFIVGLSVAVWIAILNVIVELPVPAYCFLSFMSLALIVASWAAIFQALG